MVDGTCTKFTEIEKLYKIYNELMESLDKAIDALDFHTAISVAFDLDEVIHKILEMKGIFYDSVRTISRNKRRAAREKVKRTATAERKGKKRHLREDICHEQNYQRASF